MRGSSETKFLQELLLYAASAALSSLVLFAGLRHLDPNRESSKKALEQKKEIAKRLGRPLIQTTPYEVCVKVSIFAVKFGFFFCKFLICFLEEWNIGFVLVYWVFGRFCVFGLYGQIME